MTNVVVKLTQPKSDGSLVPVKGSMVWRPTRRRVIEGAPDNIVLPLPFVAALTDGINIVGVEPSGIDWAWEVTIRVDGHSFKPEYFAVPDEGSVDFGDLVPVDPVTLASTAVPEPAWYAYATAIRNGQIGLVTVYTGDEARPTGSTVLWVGGESRPVNMASGDLWFAAVDPFEWAVAIGAAVTHEGSISRTGSGSLVAVGRPTQSATLELSGNGSLTAVDSGPGTVLLSGNGTLSRTGSFNVTGSISLSGGGTLAVTGSGGASGTIQSPDGDPDNRIYPLHTNINMTTFWVGEIFNPDAPDGSQVVSAYDGWWYDRYGGCDGDTSTGSCETEVRTSANGYFPTKMTPLENPFYVDLPFNDVSDPDAYARREEVIPWALDPGYVGNATNTNFSYMKNRWVKIIYNGRTCYAQNQDAGPGQYNDAEYVFGTDDRRPLNQEFGQAGMDVSPAVVGYLQFAELNGIQTGVSWQWIEEVDVPDGPWKTIVTTSPYDWSSGGPNQGTYGPGANLAANPSGEEATTGWGIYAGTDGAAVISNPLEATPPHPFSGGRVIRATWSETSTTSGGLYFDSYTPLVAGEPYTASLWARSSKTQGFYLGIDWINSAGSVISSTYSAVSPTLQPGIWERLSVVNAIAPLNTTRMVVTAYAYEGGRVVGDTLDVDGLLIQQSTTVNDYFDGDRGGYDWDSAPHASTSTPNGLPIEQPA